MGEIATESGLMIRHRRLNDMAHALTQEDILNFFADIKELYKETDLKFKETDRQFKETDLKFKETDRLIRETRKAIGELGNRLGEFVEEMVRPAVVRLFRERGIDVHEVHRDVMAIRDGDSMEIDLLVVNNTDVIAVECKSHLSISDVNDHIERLERFKKMFPRYAEMRVMGAVSAMVVPDEVAKYAYRKGLFVLSQSGDTMIVRNNANFKPNVW